jgi:hypothetical protein
MEQSLTMEKAGQKVLIQSAQPQKNLNFHVLSEGIKESSSEV